MSNLNDLHEALAQELLQRIKSGEAKAPDLAVAAKFLKDNEITAVPTNNNALSQLLESRKERSIRPTKPTPQKVQPFMPS